MSTPRNITILLLGETGVGKSTFINAFINYLTYETLDEASRSPRCLIPVSFTIADQRTYKSQTVRLGTVDINENTQNTTQSATQYPRCYQFTNDSIILNFIDTPGIADTSGIDKDKRNMKNLLDFISNYREINAICVLLKPNNAKVDIVFKYCLYELFSNLNKSAADNILFLFTNARSTHYAPGESGPALMALLDVIKQRPPNVDIEYSRETIYCFDNEAFRYAVATGPPNNMVFGDDFQRDYENSWKRSIEECERLMERIMELKPHNVMDTLSLNNAKQNILLLTQPLADIAKNIGDNQKQCEIHKRRIREHKGSIEELEKELYIPSVEIVSTPLDKPVTVCGHKNCCEILNVTGNIKTHYKTYCHSPCYLNSDDGNVVGNTGLLDCKAFNKYERTGPDSYFDPSEFHPDNDLTTDSDGKVPGHRARRSQSEDCNNCGHSYQVHLHTNYETQIRNIKLVDKTKLTKITNDKEKVEAKESKIKELEAKMSELSQETQTISKCMARFACFLKHNAMTPFNDAFGDYVKYLIENEKRGGSIAEKDSRLTVQKLEEVLDRYNREKKIILKEMERTGPRKSEISVKDIEESIRELCRLKHSGGDIRKMLDVQKQSKAQCHQYAKVVVNELPRSSWLSRKYNSVANSMANTIKNLRS